MKISERRSSNRKRVSPGMLLFLAVVLLPLVLGMGYAALYSTGLAGALRSGLTGQYWRTVLTNAEAIQSFLYSFYVAFAVLGLSVSLALWLVLYFRRSFRGRFFSVVLYLPLSIPATVAAFLTFQALAKSGLVSRLAFSLGWLTDLRQFPDLINDPYGLGIIAAHALLAWPFFTIYFLNSYQTERLEELERQARSLGASQAQSAWRVAVPVLWRRAFPTVVMYFIFVLGSYEVPLLLGVQSPQMVSVLTVRKLRGFNLAEMPEAYVMALLYMGLVCMLLMVVFRKRKLADDY